MFIHRYVVLAVVLLAFAGCSAGHHSPGQKVSSEISPASVYDAWNQHCADYNFDPCPASVLSTPAPVITMQDLYNGSDFSTDGDALLNAIKFSIYASHRPPPLPESYVPDVIADDTWSL